MNITVADSTTIIPDPIRRESWMPRKFEIGSRSEVTRLTNSPVFRWRAIRGSIAIRCA